MAVSVAVGSAQNNYTATQIAWIYDEHETATKVSVDSNGHLHLERLDGSVVAVYAPSNWLHAKVS